MRPPAVLIKWVDSSFQGPAGWEDLPLKAIPMDCLSLGFLVAEDDLSYTVSTSLCASDPPSQAFTPHRIPKCSVTSYKEITLD